MVPQTNINPFETPKFEMNPDYSSKPPEQIQRDQEIFSARNNLWGGEGKITNNVHKEWSAGYRIDHPTVDPGNPLDPTHPKDKYRSYFPEYRQIAGFVNIKTGIDTSANVLPQSPSGYSKNGGGSPSPDVPPNPIQGIDTRATNSNRKPSHGSVFSPPQFSYGNEVRQQSGVIGTLASIADAPPVGSKSVATQEEFKRNNVQQNQNAPAQPFQTARLESTPAMANTKTAESEQIAGGKENTAQLTNDTPSQVGAGDDAKQLPTDQVAQIEVPQVADTSNTQFLDAQFGKPASNSTTKGMQIGVDDNSLV